MGCDTIIISRMGDGSCYIGGTNIEKLDQSFVDCIKKYSKYIEEEVNKVEKEKIIDEFTNIITKHLTKNELERLIRYVHDEFCYAVGERFRDKKLCKFGKIVDIEHRLDKPIMFLYEDGEHNSFSYDEFNERI